jgi:hypothetical protein
MPEAAVTLLIELWNGEHLEKWTAYAENNVIIQPIRVGLGQKKELKIRLRQ